MLPCRLNQLLAITATFAATGAAAIAASAASPTAHTAAAARITPTGVGEIRLGDRYRDLRRKGLVRRLSPGCELAGEDARSARLRAPLTGSVDFTRTVPRKVTNIAIRGGASARGVKVGSRSAKIRDAFPKARFDHSTEQMFGITLVKVPRNGGGKLQFAVDVATNRVTLIGIPFIAFCE